MLNKVDVYYRSGQLLMSVVIDNPTEVEFIDDSSFAVLSRLEPGGDVHIFRCTREKVVSLGENFWFQQPENLILRERDAFNAIARGDSILLVSRWDTYHIYPYDLNSGRIFDDIARNHPSESRDPELYLGENQMGGRFYRNMGILFTGPEGMLNSSYASFSITGYGLESAEDIRAKVRIVDRYDWNWNYLDSYCIPFNGNVAAYSPERGYFINDYETGELLRFTSKVGPSSEGL